MKFIYTILALFLLLTLAHAQEIKDGETTTATADETTKATVDETTKATVDETTTAEAEDRAAASNSTTAAADLLADGANKAEVTTAGNSGSDAGAGNNAAASGDDATDGFECMRASSMFTALAVGIVAAYNF